MKRIDELSEKELLQELLKSQKRGNALKFVIAAACVITTCILCYILFFTLPQISSTIDKADTLIEDVSGMVETGEKTLESIDRMVDNIDGLVVENTEVLDETIKQISEIDIDSLNKSIEQLGKVVQPLSKLFSVF